MIGGIISKLFGGNKSERDIKKASPIVQSVTQVYQTFATLSNDELRSKTAEFKAKIIHHLAGVDAQIIEKNKEAESLPFHEMLQKDAIYSQVDDLQKERNKKIEEILETIMPEAFALVKETAKRFKENEELVSTATGLDVELSKAKKYITIDGEKSIFKNSWTAAGGLVTWNMIHYDVQLIGGSVLHSGKIAEMATGEGKTLVSTLPAYLNALAGEGVHIVTVNDYLAKRDQEWNGPIFEWLGLTVDCIDKHSPNGEERRKAYLADITYGTNNEFGFDYLRDNMVHSPDEMVQRKHHFAMVDEVDSVLIDDARTPLIISGPVAKGDDQQYHIHKPRIQHLMMEQEKVVRQSLNEAKKLMEKGEDDPKNGGLHLFRAFRGLPKYSPLIKYLSEPGIKVKLQKTENYYLQDQQKNMHLVDEALYFHIDEKQNSVDLTEKGLLQITKSGEDPEFFVLPDIGVTLAEVEKLELTAEEILAKKEEILNDYSNKADRIHSVHQLLKAYTLFEKDVEYVIVEDAIKIVDEQTGRIMEGRRYSDGLHQALEAKENVKIEAATQTYATITLQNYFRMYHKLCGMTGTAETEAAELWSIYKLDVVSVPTNLPFVREDKQDLVYKTKREKYKAVIDEIEQLRQQQRPVLVGTTSVEISELLSRMLQQKKIPHNVLNAKQHLKEAQVVAEAGLPGAVTIATNMAGRGTDIKLGPGVKDAGGLAIIGTERHESRRVDRQLRGRAGRQGDPGSSQFYVSLEDDLMRMFGSERIASMMDKLGYKEGDVIQHSMISNSIQRAQKKVEENNFGIRKRLLEYDDVMNKQRQVIYGKRHHALFGERLALDIDTGFSIVAESLIIAYKEQNDFEGFKLACILNFGIETKIAEEQFKKGEQNKLMDLLYQEALSHYEQRKAVLQKNALPIFKNIKLTQGSHIENVVVPFTDHKKMVNVITPLQKTIDSEGAELTHSLEKNVSLAIIDEAWKEHLRAMDDLKQSVQTAYLEQKDPLVIYKMEAFQQFKNMDGEMNKEIISFLCHSEIHSQQKEATVREAKVQKTDYSKMRSSKAEVSANGEPELIEGAGNYHNPSMPDAKPEPIKVGPKIGRNDPCFCGSSKKYKQCHGKEV